MKKNQCEICGDYEDGFTECCHIKVCSKHISNCDVCGESFCVVCVNAGNGYLCKICNLYFCDNCNIEEYVCHCSNN